LILATRHQEFVLPGKVALWVVVAVALVSGVQYFTTFLRRIVGIAGPLPPPE
jgi:hypothetical protein